jgi:hypothetical protein
MAYWIKKFARIIGFVCFFAVFLVTLDWSRPLELDSLMIALLKGIIAMALCWFVGLIIADMVFKGIVDDVPVEAIDDLEGGLLQRVRQTREQNTPKPITVTIAGTSAPAADAKAKLGQGV